MYKGPWNRMKGKSMNPSKTSMFAKFSVRVLVLK
jgi:hypothetical protein